MSFFCYHKEKKLEPVYLAVIIPAVTLAMQWMT